MKFRAAIASSDGIVVNQHFGHADRFHIVEIDSQTETCSFVETRSVAPCCHAGDHPDGAFDNAFQTALYDAQAVLVSKIGSGAADFLEAKGLAVYEAPHPIEPLLEKIIKDKLWEVDQWQYLTTS